MRLALFLLAAAVAGCASEQQSRLPTPDYGDAGRIVGGRLGTVALAERCAATFPELANEIDPALRDWRWRNDPVAASVEQRMWVALAERGATAQEVEAGKASFAYELQRIRVDMENWFASWSPPRQRGFCERIGGRLALGEDDLVRRYPGEIRRWQGATR